MTTTDMPPDRLAVLRVAYDTMIELSEAGVDILRAVSVLATVPASIRRTVPSEDLYAASLLSVASGIEAATRRTMPEAGAVAPERSLATYEIIFPVILDAVERLDKIDMAPQEVAVLFATVATALVLQQEGDPVAVAAYLRGAVAAADADRLKAAAAPVSVH